MSEEHHRHHEKAQVAALDSDNQNVQTVVNVVYVTENPSAATTDGATHRYNGHPIANTAAPSSSGYSVPVRQQRPNHVYTPSPASITPTFSHETSTRENFRSSATPTTFVSSRGSSSAALFASSTSGFAMATSMIDTAPVASSHSSSSSNTNSLESSSSGMSTGGKVGLAIGIILAIALIAGAAFFLYRRTKKQEDHQRLDDEKSDFLKRSQSTASHVSVRRGLNSAPRLSLRPVTQMFPPMAEKQDASSLIASSAAAARSRTPEPISAPIRAPISAPTTSATSEASNPFDDQDNNIIATPAPVATPSESPNPERPTTSRSQEAPSPQPFPTAVAGSRRNSPPGPGPDNVHRVQLDFKPSMDDELELRAGSLVRLLHEYDDGWALCIRLDRSQQGVVPRTCISKLPVKPRQGPPPGAMRGPPPQGRPRGHSNAPGSRGHPRTYGPPRPMGPPGYPRGRSQSNAPRYPMGPPQPRPRSNSEAMSARRVTPPGVSPLSSPASSPPPPQQAMPARKPVPGQAM